MGRRFHLTTLGCPKNQVDSDKLHGMLTSQGMTATDDVADADMVVVNTCAFVDEARQESIETIQALADTKTANAELVVTGCLAERYGSEVTQITELVDTSIAKVAGFGQQFAPVPVLLTDRPTNASNNDNINDDNINNDNIPDFDLLNLPRPSSPRPWAYVKIAEGCDRACGFCAIPSFRGPQRSRSLESILDEVDALAAKEIVLVAQDLASYGRDNRNPSQAPDPSTTPDTSPIVDLVKAVSAKVPRTRLLYLYPSDLRDDLIDAICETGTPYFDLSLQHVSAPLLRRMRRWGNGDRFLERINAIRAHEPSAAFRSNFIVGYPGETDHDHDQLLDFIDAAQLDWCGFFAYSQEAGTYSATLDHPVAASLMHERLNELTEKQDRITASKRDVLIGTVSEVLIDAVYEDIHDNIGDNTDDNADDNAGHTVIGRSHREAPEIDGIIQINNDNNSFTPGSFIDVVITESLGTDLIAKPTQQPTRT